VKETDVLLLAGLILAYSLVSRRLEKTILSAPMLFLTAGLVVGADGLGWLHLSLNEGVLHVLAELTLVLVLFGDATRIDLKVMRQELGLPVRLLGFGLPLSIAAGGLVAKILFPQLHWFEAAALGAVLAPTDAALGQAVVSSPAVPVRIRQALNVESGLNDGIALPFVLVFASLASLGHGEVRTPGQWAQFAAMQVVIGPIAGGLIAYAGGAVIRAARKRGFVEDIAERLAGLALAALCFAGTELVGGNGFIGAFVGGVIFGHTQRHLRRHVVTFLEAEGELLMLAVFLGMGASLVVPAWSHASLALALYVTLSLTLVRMVPVSLCLVASGLRGPSHVFVGWFGPRGLASLLYGILLLTEANLPNEELVFAIIVLTTLASVFLHGTTAAPGAAVYGKLASDAETYPMENGEVTEHVVRGAKSNRSPSSSS
jgi:NhaP-type Na+/H+ or K+/H+ antiporter